MSEEEMEDLLKDLEERGFKDEQLRADIERMEALDLPTFNIRREKVFGEELMSYKLEFQWLERSLGYEFTAIGVNHRMPVDIGDYVANGITSLKLDQEMAAINWQKYWELKLNGADDKSIKGAYNCIDGLAQLLLSEGELVNLAGEQLMYKHWAPEIFIMFSKDPDRIRKTFEHSYSFQISAHPDITAELAYLIISERLDALEMQLEDLGLSEVLPSEAFYEIHRSLKHLPEAGEVKFNFSTETYYASLNIPIRLVHGWYQVDGYELAVTSFPEIKHGVFNGVSSERLDKKLATVDWKNDEDIVALANDLRSTFPRDIELLQEELRRMALDPNGKIAADLLMLKHWLCAPVFKDFVSESAMKQLDSLPVNSALFFTETTIDQARNMFLGRPVMREDFGIKDEPGCWQRLDFSNSGAPQLVSFEGISMKGLQYLISVLPVDDYRKAGIEKGLIAGDEVKTEAKSGKYLHLRMNDSASGILLFDHHKKEIPYNFQLDPEWRPQEKISVHQQKELEHPDKKVPRVRLNNKYKGGSNKGL